MEIYLLMIQARQFMVEALKESGGCDHSTGICQCAEVRLIEAIDHELYAELGSGIVKAFFDAEPIKSEDLQLAWAKDGSEIAHRCTVQALRDIQPEQPEF